MHLDAGASKRRRKRAHMRTQPTDDVRRILPGEHQDAQALLAAVLFLVLLLFFVGFREGMGAVSFGVEKEINRFVPALGRRLSRRSRDCRSALAASLNTDMYCKANRLSRDRRFGHGDFHHCLAADW